MDGRFLGRQQQRLQSGEASNDCKRDREQAAMFERKKIKMVDFGRRDRWNGPETPFYACGAPVRLLSLGRSYIR